ncbi:hypothetical protein [Shinella sp.]|jgi:hypothetical protein
MTDMLQSVLAEFPEPTLRTRRLTRAAEITLLVSILLLGLIAADVWLGRA